MTTKRIALYPGSFDPITYGHIDIIERALMIFDQVIIAIAVNIRKKPLFDLDTRIELITQSFEGYPVLVETFDDLLVDYAQKRGCDAILRGLRGMADFDYELRMTTMNRHLSPQIETVFLITDPRYLHISSSLVKEVAAFGGNIAECVPDHVRIALDKKLEVKTPAVLKTIESPAGIRQTMPITPLKK